MNRIPSKCPKCGNIKVWKKEANPFAPESYTALGWVRAGIVLRGLFAKPVKRAMGLYKVTYRCRNCGFRQEYPTDE